MSEIKRAIITGQGASGKDHLVEYLIESGYKFPVTYTTRLPRQGEIEGVHYNFTTVKRFKEMIKSDLMYEYVSYENRGKKSNETWYYGRTKEDFYAGNIMIMTPAGLVQLSEQDRKDSFIIFLDINEDIRRERMDKRVDADDTERRLKTDREDFALFENYDYRIDNPNFYSSNVHMLLETTIRLFPEIRNNSNQEVV